MKKAVLVFIAILAVSLFLNISAVSTAATYSYGETIVIHLDGSVTPASAPLVRSGNTYLVTDDVLIPSSTNEGFKIEKDNVVLDGGGHKLRGNGQSSAIYMNGRVDVTVTGFMLENFYWGLEILNSTRCIISRNNLTAIMYPIYLKDSLNNKFYHNNIYRIPHYTDTSNIWDNGYPSGGNYWDGYPYPDAKKGPEQNLPGSDGIGDKPVAEEIFNQGGANIDHYPLMSKQTFQVGTTTNLKVSVKDGVGNSISGANIASTAQPIGQPVLSGTSGADGTDVFSSLLPGSYEVQASKSGYATATLSVNAVEGSTTDVTFALLATQTTSNLKVTVKDKNGGVIAGADISSTSQPRGQSALGGTTGSDGMATFSGVLPGDYTVQASKGGYVSGSAQGNMAAGGTDSIGITLQVQSSGGSDRGGIPGFPFEAVAIGVLLYTVLTWRTRTKQNQLP